MFDISSVDVHSLTSDNLDSVLSSNLTEQFSALRNYCSNQDVMPIYIVALDSRQFTELESSVVSGSIDTASLDSGEEVVVIAPQKSPLMWNMTMKTPIQVIHGALIVMTA